MITKYTYTNVNDTVVRQPLYSFTTIEELNERIGGIENMSVLKSIVNTTLKGESERTLIELEDSWYVVQQKIQTMDIKRNELEAKLKKGDTYGNPFPPTVQNEIKAEMADLSVGEVTVEKEFYDHHTRTTHRTTDTVQTTYSLELLKRTEMEDNAPFLAGYRGVATAPLRPEVEMDATKETYIKKELVRQEINLAIGDDKDLIADMSQALNALIKKVNGDTLTQNDNDALTTYNSRQSEIATILTKDYK